MSKLWTVPIDQILRLTPEPSVEFFRQLLRAECSYARLAPNSLTISTKLMTADGGIDAQVETPPAIETPADCLVAQGITGFQLKSGDSFRPWQVSSIRTELLDGSGRLHPEVSRLVSSGGKYVLMCTGHDLTPQQRNKARDHIANIFTNAGFANYEDRIAVLGASQIAEYAERYPGTVSLVTPDPLEEGWSWNEWRQSANLSNSLQPSEDQGRLIETMRGQLRSDATHIRVLGEPGLGKTRIVLEALREPDLSGVVVYFEHGSQFESTKLFRSLIRFGQSKPLILVLDELSERDLASIWNNLKPRTGYLKIVSMDHGTDESRDDSICSLSAPSLTKETIQAILTSVIEPTKDVERWVDICEGSPRVALAVAENLRANPSDLLKPPSTVPLWDRFLHGYEARNDSASRQIDCVAQHLALFDRFGFDAPVSDEAAYISQLVSASDPSIGWARFQEIVHDLRRRRVLQGSRTLFFVPKALHIYLWTRYWERYGRGFQFTRTYESMPESLHAWFLQMFRFARGDASKQVIDEIVRPDGIFSDKRALTSDKGTRFISHLAEANPSAVLRLLEATIGNWSDTELMEFKTHRQSIVWALEKIAVWTPFTQRAMRVLCRLAANENANYSNNASGTLIGLFRIGPEAAATEAAPDVRLIVAVELLQSKGKAERDLGLKAMKAALDAHGRGFRTIGPEYQGIKERAKLWSPDTYGQWWAAQRSYFQSLLKETSSWTGSDRVEAVRTIVNAIDEQLHVKDHQDMALNVLEELVSDTSIPAQVLISFFSRRRLHEERKAGTADSCVTRRIYAAERKFTRRDLATRFQRYVVHVDYFEWDEDMRGRLDQRQWRAKPLVSALSKRLLCLDHPLEPIRDLLAPPTHAIGMAYFGAQMARGDHDFALLKPVTEIALATRHTTFFNGYLSAILELDPNRYVSTISELLGEPSTAWLGAQGILGWHYNEQLFSGCLSALEEGWISPSSFVNLRYGKAILSVPMEAQRRLLDQLHDADSVEARSLLIEFFHDLPFDNSATLDPRFVLAVVTQSIPGNDKRDTMRGYYWREVCHKLVKWEPAIAMDLLDSVLSHMATSYAASYDTDVVAMANLLVQLNADTAWDVIRQHFEQAKPKYRADLCQWLKGGISALDGEKAITAAIAMLPLDAMRQWIAVEPDFRAPLLAHCVPPSLDDTDGGELTRALLQDYGHIDGVQSGISSAFHSGSWTGPMSLHLRNRRKRYRKWLANGYEPRVAQWIEREIEHLDENITRAEIREERSDF